MKSDESRQFMPMRKFQNYEMHFLISPIYLDLHEPVSISTSKYGHKIEGISCQDCAFINNSLKMLNESCELRLNWSYIDGKNAEWFDDDLNVHEFKPDKKWLITIKVIGMKTDRDGLSSPVWKLDRARHI